MIIFLCKFYVNYFKAECVGLHSATEQGLPLVQIHNSMGHDDADTELSSSGKSLLNVRIVEEIDSTLGIYCIFCYVIYYSRIS